MDNISAQTGQYRYQLRVIRTKAIPFLTEKIGSDIERLWIWLTSSSIDFESMKKFNFRVVLCRIRWFPTLIGKIKWLEHGLPFKNVSSWEETLKFTHCDGRSTLLCNVYNFYEWLRFYVSFELHYYINIRYIYYMFYYLKKTE